MDYPLLDLRDLWRDVHARLQEIQDLTEHLFCESEYTWGDMADIRFRIRCARKELGEKLPPGILEGIAKDEADLQEWEEKLG